MLEIDIRQALWKKLDAEHKNEPDAYIVEELGLCQGEARIDIAAVNGDIHGFEIKSGKDTLKRLAGQKEIYSKTLERVTIVTTKKHIKAIRESIPHWWGILQAEEINGRVFLNEVRAPKPNPCVDPYSIAQLLWRNEAMEIIERMGLSKGLKSKPRTLLWEKLVEILPIDKLAEHIRLYLRTRENWRSVPQRT